MEALDSMIGAPGGDLWVETLGGLWRHRRGDWVRFDSVAGLGYPLTKGKRGDAPILAITAVRSNELWAVFVDPDSLDA